MPQTKGKGYTMIQNFHRTIRFLLLLPFSFMYIFNHRTLKRSERSRTLIRPLRQRSASVTDRLCRHVKTNLHTALFRVKHDTRRCICYCRNCIHRHLSAQYAAVTVVELILILVILIALLVIFKTQLTNLVNTLFDKVTSESSSI